MRFKDEYSSLETEITTEEMAERDKIVDEWVRKFREAGSGDPNNVIVEEVGKEMAKLIMTADDSASVTVTPVKIILIGALAPAGGCLITAE